MIVIGDVHGEWDTLADKLYSFGITQQELIQVGDFGVGFGPRADATLFLDGLLPSEGGSDGPDHERHHRQPGI